MNADFQQRTATEYKGEKRATEAMEEIGRKLSAVEGLADVAWDYLASINEGCFNNDNAQHVAITEGLNTAFEAFFDASFAVARARSLIEAAIPTSTSEPEHVNV
jgi:hypothetical protein